MKHLIQHLQEKLVINRNTKVIKISDEVVDLGLPSGLLWCNHNVGAKSETDRGLYFSWANTDGHYDDGYKFNEYTYYKTNGSKLTKSFTSGDKEYDAVTANMGPEWRMPTKEEFKELYDNTEHEWTEIDGVKGMKFSSKEDPKTFVFFPAVGWYDDTTLRYDTTDGFYWTVDIDTFDTRYAYYMYFDSSGVNPAYSYNSYIGISVRAVKD